MDIVADRYKAIAANRICAAALLFAVPALLWPSSESLWQHWRSNVSYGHGHLVAVVSLAWAIVALMRAAPRPDAGRLPAFLTLVVVLAAWLVGIRANLNIAHQLLLPLAMWLAIAAAFGMGMARVLTAPLLFLYFAIPVWDYALPVLQRTSVAATDVLLRIVGLPAQIVGDRVTIPAGVFEIAEGCAGLRYLVVALAVAFAASALHRLDLGRAALVLLATAGIAMAMNWLRILIVIYAGHVSGMQHYFVRVEHESLGMALFLPMLLGVGVIARRVGRTARDVTTVASASSEDGPVQDVAAMLVPVVVVGSLVAIASWLAQREQLPPASPGLGSLPLAMDDWQGPFQASDGWRPEFRGAYRELRAGYVDRAGHTVNVYVNVYPVQSQGRELVSYLNRMLAPGEWQMAWSGADARMAVADRPSLATVEAQTVDGQMWLVAHTYAVDGVVTDIAAVAQITYGLRSLFNPVPAGVVAMAVQCTADCKQARRLLAEFWADLGNRLIPMIPRAGSMARAGGIG